MSGLTAASEALLDDMYLLSWGFTVSATQSDTRSIVAERLAAIEAAAIASVLAADRVKAALHADCEAEWRRRDPGALFTQHGPEAHNVRAASLVAWLSSPPPPPPMSDEDARIVDEWP